MALEELLVSNLDKKKKKGDDKLDVGENVPKVASLYGCRFCPMRFVKSQALGGHMNRHRQEREKEQYQQARELVSHMQQQPRWNTLLTDRNIGQDINAAMEAQAQLIPMQLNSTLSQSILAGGGINHFHPAVFASTNLATNGTASTWLDYLSQPTSTATAAATSMRLKPAPALTVVADGTLAAALQVGNSGTMQDKFLTNVLQPPGLKYVATNNLYDTGPIFH